MSEDKEIQAINSKKLKEKGAKVVEQNQKVNYEAIVMQVSQFLNAIGLQMMNMSEELRTIIANERQKGLAKQNAPDNEKA